MNWLRYDLGDPVDRMNAAREWKQENPHETDARCLTVLGVCVSRFKRRKYLSVSEVAAQWGRSEARVKQVLAAGRVVGAYRARAGKNRPWKIPALPESVKVNEAGTKVICVYRAVSPIPGRRGPVAAYAGQGDAIVPI